MGIAAPEGPRAAFWGRARTRVEVSLLFATLVIIFMGLLLYPPKRSDGHQAHAAATSRYVLLQMNLCLSGLAGCFQGAQYPLGVGDARARIVDSHADAVTLNEVCSGDVEELARVTGYHMRFVPVAYRGELLPCRTPRDRGLYGIAVLTEAGIRSSIGDAFGAQDDIEQRHWICATTAAAVTVCATHLDARWSSSAESVNDAQCEEFAEVLQALETSGPLIAAGDMNRWESCAPAGMWTRADDDATQAAGAQHVYGDAQFSRPAANVDPMAYSDHDALVVISRLAR